jgi:hypothetical protein
MTVQEETYLGDGLYASFDGFMIILRAPREDGDDWIGLEPAIASALQEFMDRCYQRKSHDRDT